MDVIVVLIDPEADNPNEARKPSVGFEFKPDFLRRLRDRSRYGQLHLSIQYHSASTPLNQRKLGIRATCALLALAILGVSSFLTRAQDREQPVIPQSSIQVKIPLGDIEIAYVESNEGMVLIAECAGMSVKSQRLYFGDGKIAVMYEASIDGFVTPLGKVDSAAIEIKKGDSVSVPSTKLEKWGANRGAVYILADGVKFVTSDK